MPLFTLVTNQELAQKAGISSSSGLVHHRVRGPPVVSTNHVLTTYSNKTAGYCKLDAFSLDAGSCLFPWKIQYSTVEASLWPLLYLTLPIRSSKQYILPNFCREMSKGRYVIYWGGGGGGGGGGLGLQRGGSSMKFWSIGGRVKVFKSLKVRGGSCF